MLLKQGTHELNHLKQDVQHHQSKFKSPVIAQSYRLSLKENKDSYDCSPSFRAKPSDVSPTKLQGDIQEKLQSIRKKYQNQLGTIGKNEINPSPLKDLNNLNQFSRYPQVTICQSKQSIPRSFSFINVQRIQSKPQTFRNPEQSFVEPALDLNKIGFSEWKPSNHVFDMKQGRSKTPQPHFYSFQDNRLNEQKKNYQIPPPARHLCNKSELYTPKENEFSKEFKNQRAASFHIKEPLKDNTDLTSYIKATPVIINGQRIQSIDKINDRIKQILKSINSNDTQHIQTYRKHKFDQSKNSFNADAPRYSSPVSRYPTQIKQDTKPILTSYNKNINKELPTEAYSYKKPIQADKHISFNSSPYQTKQSVATDKYINKFDITGVKDVKQQYSNGGERSITFRTPQNEHKAYDGPSRSIPKQEVRDLDVQIQRIQDKIKKAEEEKRRLWLQDANLKPNYKKKEQSIQTSNKSSKVEKFQAWKNELHTKSTTKYPTPSTIQDYQKSAIQNKKVSMQLSSKQYMNLLERENLLKEKESKTKDYIHSSPVPKAQQLSIKIVPVTCQNDTQIKTCRQTKKFINCLKQQVSLDQELRNAKIWLDDVKIQDKWNQITSQLNRKGIKLSLKQVQQQFQNSLQQHNPFFSAKNYHETISTVVQKYVKAQNYWQTELVNKFDVQQMKNEQFDEVKLDLERKGYLTVQDFVRFLNIETGTFYRNRDLILMFRRLTPHQNITFSDFITKIAKR